MTHLYEKETPRYVEWLHQIDVLPDTTVRDALKSVLDAVFGIGDGEGDEPRDFDNSKQRDWDFSDTGDDVIRAVEQYQPGTEPPKETP